MSIPRLAITTGEPAGIGPDVTLAAAQAAWPAQLVAVGDRELLAARAKALDLDISLPDYSPEFPAEAHLPGRLPVLAVPLSTPAVPGQLDSRNADYVLKTLDEAVDGCLAERFDAMVTAPVQKSIINEGGVAFSGHTEYLAERTGASRVVMMLAADTLRVALATTHLPLSAVPGAIDAALIEEVLQIIDDDLRRKLGIASPAIAVLGLNPHAGEDGHLGREEIEVIAPCLEKLRQAGLNLRGPLPADTAFNPEMLDWADTYLAMYHDQGLPVLKYAGFGSAINVTLGLPIVRTSVDHGTALDLAATGRADAGSMGAAIEAAMAMC